MIGLAMSETATSRRTVTPRQTVTSGVSVIVPTWNRAERLAGALESVLAQTRPADEVIVVDDGSTDGTPELLARRFPEVKALSIEHSGVSAARNHGIARARGEWLAFLDSDDLWHEEKLAAQLAALEREGEMRLCHTDEIWIRDGRRVNPRRRHLKTGGWIFQHCLPLCAISPSAVTIHRSVFETVGYFDESFPACEDYDLWLRVTSRFPVHYVDRPLVTKVGGHDDQLSRTVPALDRYRIRALEKILAEGVLGEDDRRAATAMLLEKIAIYRQGVERRGRRDELADLDRLARHYRPASSAGASEGSLRP